MLTPDLYVWILRAALVSGGLVAALLLGFGLQRLVGKAVQSYARRRERRLLPLVLHATSDLETLPELQRALRPLDLPIVREMLMRLAIDVREEDGTEIVRLCSRLGLLEREVRSLSSWRARTRRRAAANLGLLQQAAAVPAILELLADRNTNTRLAAIDAIGDIRCEQGLIALIPLLADPEPAVVWRAREALSRAGVDVGLQLARFLALTQDPTASAAAVDTFRWVRPDRAETRLRELSRAQSPHLRAIALRSLAALRTEGSSAALRESVSDPSSIVRLEAIRGLRTLARPEAVPDLCEALQDESRGIRIEAVRGLRGMGDRGITALVELLQVEGRRTLSPALLRAAEAEAGMAL